jgi:hypothetical protein
MAEAKAREGLKLKPFRFLYCPQIIIPVTYTVPNNPPASFVGIDIQMI